MDDTKAIIEGIAEELRWTVRDTGIIVDATYETFNSDFDISFQQVIGNWPRRILMSLTFNAGYIVIWNDTKQLRFELANPTFPDNLITAFHNIIKDPRRWEKSP